VKQVRNIVLFLFYSIVIHVI